MKTKKNKLIKLLKIGLLFFGISLLLWNCEQEKLIEEQQIENNINPLFTEIQNQFNKRDFEKTIPYKYEVDWETSTKQYSEDLQTNFYEFNLIYSDAFNPERLNIISPKKQNIAFKLVALENREKGYVFYIAKFYQEKQDGITFESLLPSLNKNSGYEGVTHLYDKNDNIIFAKFITKEEDNNLEKYLDPTLRNDTDNTMQRYVTTCETVTVHHWIDWYYYEYDDWGNIVNSYYSHTTYAGSSTTEECTTRWVPHPYDYGEGGLFGTGVGCDETGECVEDVEDALLDDQVTSNLSGKAACILRKLKETSTGFVNAIKKFDGEFPVAHLHIIEENLGNTRGRTVAPNSNSNSPNSPDYVITVKLNNNSNIHGFNYRPNLMTAKTIAHEVIHAEMYRKLLSVLNNGGTLTGVTIQDLVNALSNGDYPGIYDYYRRHKDWQHQQMATHYRQTIADILKEFDNYQHINQFYLDLAWEGLKYPNISTWSTQSQQEKDRINKVINDYINANKNETCQ